MQSLAVSRERDQALSGIATAQARLGNHQGALATVRNIENFEIRNSTYRVIVGVQLEGGEFQGALITARSFGNRDDLANALNRIANAQVRAGDVQGAARSIAEGLAAARRIVDAEGRVRALRCIAQTQVEAAGQP